MMKIIAKVRKNLLYIILAVVCATAFFIHEFIEDQSIEYKTAYQNYKTEKAKRTKALNILKEESIGTESYIKYDEKRVETDLAWQKLKEVKANEEFLGFLDFQQFVGEIGWAVGLFIYSLFNLIMVFHEVNNSKKGKVLLHTTLLSISLYFISWALFSHDDFPKYVYMIFSILTSIILAYAVIIITSQRYKHIKSLMLNIRSLIGFMFNNTKSESEEKMWDVLKEIKHERKG
ncbi:hypothetical protein IMCC3317_11340 [Kordia antarctica]|uniref:Uncharacterized protein n=1 Tax=Kordia antarctica TaxID=1218801 RepID=A0A7L4ZHU1_9FLAO|nr:hypothetical protein [Kordia antarctica]QHI35786.1 hypothetical protein IMCC3317_11340 [Kordia antarctica]